MDINTDRSELDANGKLNENETYEAAEDVPEVRLEKMDEQERFPLSPDQHSGKCEPTYQPGKGFDRYSGALKNMIPVRRKVKESGIVGVDTAGLFSVITFSWLSKLIYLARRKQLTLEDIPEISPYDACNYNVDRLELLWEDELARQGPEKASLFKVVWKFSRTRIFAAGSSFAISTLMGSLGTSIVMRKLLEYVQSEDGIYYEGLTWASLLPLAEFGRTLFYTLGWALSYRTALRIRSACSMLLYKKIVRLNNSGDKTIGKVVNIFTNDSQRIFELVLNLPTLVGGPIMTLYAMIYALWLFGPIALCGIVIFFVFYPFQYIMSRVIKNFQAKAMQFCDVRVKLMNEILDCIKIIKMYAWEEWFSQKLKNSRNKEQEFIFKTSYWLTSNRSIAPTVPLISVIISFIAYISIGNNLTAAQAFSYLTLLGGRFGFALILFQLSIETIIPGRISLERVKSILVLKSGDFVVSKPTSESQSIAISQGTFTYDTFDNPSEEMSQKKDDERKNKLENPGDDSEREKLNTPTDYPKQFQVLTDITFEATKGKLVGICGHVGSGKSSLLLAALGQLRVLEGKAMRDGSCAYVSQQAWIINATLRENILFGTPYDHGKYHKAIHASSLIQDIGMMPAGDQTEIGEKGVNLSGGQKQRVALARALYADRDIYFLDDPLSAVDSRVGSDIFDNYILKALSEKTVLFVTHQIQYLNHCDDIFMMSDGRIVEHGTHDELMKLGNEYAMMVSAVSAENTNEKTTSTKESTKVLTKLNEDVYSSKENRSAIVSVSSGIEKENISKKDTSGAMLTVPEVLQHGTIKAHTYHAYIVAAGGYFISFFIITIFVITNGSTAFSSWWLALWIKAGGGNTTVVRNNETVISDNINDNPDSWYYQAIYGSSIVIILLSVYFQTLLFMKASIKASTKLHNDLFEKIISSSMRFFDTTPTGRIQHLFSKDMDEVDYRVPTSILNSIHYVLVMLFSIIAISFVFPWLILLLFAIGIGYYFLSNLFRTGVRDLRRLENHSRGPMISIVTATVQGLSTIHAFEKEADFLRKFTNIFDANSKCLLCSQGATRWFAARVDLLTVIIIWFTSFLVIALRDQVPPALAGLSLSYAANLSGILQYTTRQLLEAEVRFISVEKINDYIRTLIGEDRTSQPNVEPLTTWPVTAEIKFKKVGMAYGDESPLILRNVSFSVNAGEKIGIVGRTGSGKSSLTAALFRLVELAEGKIEIDDVDISKISLKQLRTKLSIIPQDPILFSGSIRSNLDPFKLYTDAELWDALEKTKLKSRVQAISGHLDASVGSGGDSLSVGERQLLCLTRALLRNTKILVLDEATAAVDPETEIAVQNMIQQEFAKSTVLTIAHRLQTVLPLNRILVMDDGKILEFDTPSNLLSNKNSEFSKMLAAAEKAMN